MCRWVVLALAVVSAGCLARVERTVIPARKPSSALEKSATALRREGFVVPTVDRERGLVRTAWRFTERADGDGFLYYRYLVEQPAPDAEEVFFRIEVIRCRFAPHEGEEWDRSNCDRMPPRVPLWASDDYERIGDVLKRVLK